ncbi:hypothetical protein [Actinophytocola sp. KF-1]
MVETVLVVIAAAIVLLAAVAALRPHRRRVRAARVDRLYQAAVTGDRDRLRQARSVDLTDTDGNTALHLAYYHGRQEAIEALVAFGADEHLRNAERLLPAEMREVAAIEDLLTAGADCLDTTGEWLDGARGREVYDQLRNRRPRIFNPALVRRVLASERQPQLLYLAIKLGVVGSERKLAEILHGYGTVTMATDYLNCGSAVLRAAAEVWARRRGYTILHTGHGRSVSWGRF